MPRVRRRRHAWGALASAAAVVGAGVFADDLVAQVGGDAEHRSASAALTAADGSRVGVVSLEQRGAEGSVRVRIRAEGLPPGFHGFHVHAVGRCEAPGFTSAGGHLNPEGAHHPGHAGDMPVLYVMGDGRARATFFTDRLDFGALEDADGSAVIIHAQPDNYANIPADRYDPDPDATTLATGDAGGRIACGVIR